MQFLYSIYLVFNQSQEALYFAVTFAIFEGGVGAVIIGGLYWDRVYEGAWAAMIVGAVVAVTGTIVPQFSDTWLSDGENLTSLKEFILKLREINGIKFYGISMAASSFSYIAISLLTFKEKVNMDKLLNRGKYSIVEEKIVVKKGVKSMWRIFGIGDEFTTEDKVIYLVSYVWNIFFTLVFISGTIYNLSNEVVMN